MLSIFQFFATKTDASVLRMLNGSPAERLLAPIADYITSKCDAHTCPLQVRCTCLPHGRLPGMRKARTLRRLPAQRLLAPVAGRMAPKAARAAPLRSRPLGMFAFALFPYGNTGRCGRGGRIHTRLGCREVLFEVRGGEVEVTGLRLSRAGREQVARADAYIAALDVPGALAKLVAIALGFRKTLSMRC